MIKYITEMISQTEKHSDRINHPALEETALLMLFSLLSALLSLLNDHQRLCDAAWSVKPLTVKTTGDKQNEKDLCCPFHQVTNSLWVIN